MMENAISSSSLYSPGSTLNYSQAAMMGLTGSHGSLPDTQQLGYPSHSSIPNIILTGEATWPWRPRWGSWAECLQGAWQLQGASSPEEMAPLPCRMRRPDPTNLDSLLGCVEQAPGDTLDPGPGFPYPVLRARAGRAGHSPSPASATQAPQPH